MPVSFRIFPGRGLVYVRYAGHTYLDESFAAIADYMRHPDFRPGQKQLVDLAAVTGYERDFARLLELQAGKADLFGGSGLETLIVYYAPTPQSRDLARLVMRSWEPFDHVIARIQETEADALALLGEPERDFDTLMALADET
ncbi:MAG: hypothetical protein ACWA5A_12630 [Marinibacterium sp.]